jgi:hypothetical protein
MAVSARASLSLHHTDTRPINEEPYTEWAFGIIVEVGITVMLNADDNYLVSSWFRIFVMADNPDYG